MSLPDSLRNGRIQYVTLWALSALCFGLGATNTAVLGLEQKALLLMATVLAAVTAEYSRRDRRCDRQPGS